MHLEARYILMFSPAADSRHIRIHLILIANIDADEIKSCQEGEGQCVKSSTACPSFNDFTWLASDDRDSSWPSSLIFSFRTWSISSWVPITELPRDTLERHRTSLAFTQSAYIAQSQNKHAQRLIHSIFHKARHCFWQIPSSLQWSTDSVTRNPNKIQAIWVIWQNKISKM